MRPLEPGMTLRSYRLIGRLGQGGGGEVWEAGHTSGVAVALKAHPRTGNDQERRLRKEFERLRVLRIPGVVRVLDVGVDQGYVFFAMELAEGQTLDRYVAGATDLAERVQRTIRAGQGICQGLIGMHSLGLSHRDIKPANILVDSQGRVTLVDFGTVRFEEESEAAAGTVAYMAPEQRLGHHEDHRVDLYALGIVLYECISKKRLAPGGERRSLALLGPEVPLELAHLIDRLCALDRTARPSAIDCEAAFAALWSGASLPRAPWPSPTHYTGDVAPLLEASAVVVGEPGTGCTRMVTEARRRWFRKGYTHAAGRAVADRPYGPLREIVRELMPLVDRAHRDAMSPDARAVLKFLDPQAPITTNEVLDAPLDPAIAATAICDLVDAIGPVGLIVWSGDGADPGTLSVLPELAARLPAHSRLWVTARTAVADLSVLHPPQWTHEDEVATLTTVLPDHTTFPTGEPTTPLEGLARAWRVLAHLRGEPGPAEAPPAALSSLSVLDEPFPRGVAQQMVDNVEPLLLEGHLDKADGDRLRFADRATHRLCARTAGPDDHRAAAAAWKQQATEPDRALQVAHHALLAGDATPEVVEDAIHRVLDLADPVEIDRWVQLRDLYFPHVESFTLRYAKLYAQLNLRPTHVRVASIKKLARDAETLDERGRAAHLALLWRGPETDLRRAAARGRRWADRLSNTEPSLASKLYRQAALASLAIDDLDGAIAACSDALRMAREAAAREDEPTEPHGIHAAVDPLAHSPDVSATPDEVAAGITLSAALLYEGRIRDAVEFCAELRKRCRESGDFRGYGALLTNEALGHLSRGYRADARQTLAESRQIQRTHQDPVILANTALIQARLAVERGDLAATRRLLDIATTAAQSLDYNMLLCEVWTLVLEAAVQTANKTDAERAMAGYEALAAGSTRDHWPAPLARWRWLTGDIDGALAATEQPRLGHSGRVVEAERCRLLLVAGRLDEARLSSVRLMERAMNEGMEEIALFARLVSGSASAAPDAEYAPLVAAALDSRWVHLHLGAHHLDALRRQRRGENVGAILRRLRSRSRDIGHKLYLALGREDAWGTSR